MLLAGLWILMGISVFLVLIWLFSSTEEKEAERTNRNFQSSTADSFRQIKEQMFNLEMDVKKNIRFSLDITKQIKELKEAGRAGSLPAKSGAAVFENGPAPGLTAGADLEIKNRLSSLEEENRQLARKAHELSVQVEALGCERDEQDKLIERLRRSESDLRQKITDMGIELGSLKEGLEQAVASKRDMREKLLKMKTVSADNEKEIEQLRQDNRELMENMFFERNS